MRTPGLPAGSLASHRLSPSSLSGQSSAYFAPLSTEADSCFPASQRLPLETWRKQRPLPPGRERADRRLRLPFGRFAWVQYRDLSLAHVKTEALKTGGHKPGVTAHCGTCRAGAAFAPSAPWDTIVAVDVGAGEGLSFLQWRCSLAIRLGVVLAGLGRQVPGGTRLWHRSDARQTFSPGREARAAVGQRCRWGLRGLTEGGGQCG